MTDQEIEAALNFADWTYRQAPDISDACVSLRVLAQAYREQRKEIESLKEVAEQHCIDAVAMSKELERLRNQIWEMALGHYLNAKAVLTGEKLEAIKAGRDDGR